MASTIDRMSKKKPPPPPKREVIFLEVAPLLKARLRRLADLHSRTLLAEARLALLAYIEQQEKREKLPPLEEEG
jgi:hypothetical protein